MLYQLSYSRSTLGSRRIIPSLARAGSGNRQRENVGMRYAGPGGKRTVVDGPTLSLLLGAVGVGVVHTVLGPDHYGPLAMLASARGWSRSRTAAIALLFGLGHVLSSVALCLAAVATGWAVGLVERIESGRGDVAAWALLGFGLAYGLWGARRAVRRRRGFEAHSHGHLVHVHAHGRDAHTHLAPAAAPGPSFWALFAVFILGPCEPLIPLFLVPVSRGDRALAAATAVVFGIATLASMVTLTVLFRSGAARVLRGGIAAWDHALAGGVIAASALAILLLGV